MRKVSYRNFIKPFMDRLVAGVAFLFLLPLFLMVVLLLFIANRREIFFFQSRPGKNGKIFKVIKFRTMNDKRDLKGNLLPDAARLTPIGILIRKTSLDEIPQLINVLKGDMSLIGPRPLLVEYLPLYSEEQKRRHNVLPGITGWAQVNGRNAIAWEKRFEYDVWYVDNLSFKLDVRIFFLTVLKVFNSEGITSDTSVTMEKFCGNLKTDL